jgi:hypothetical protein
MAELTYTYVFTPHPNHVGDDEEAIGLFTLTVVSEHGHFIASGEYTGGARDDYMHIRHTNGIKHEDAQRLIDQIEQEANYSFPKPTMM